MSSLGEQLAKRRSQQGAAGFRPLHVRPSLLFDHKQAATIELAHIHLLALSGLEQLQKLEPRVKPFEQTLFAPASVEINRETQTPEVNKRLDESIESFLQLLSPYFMLKATHKVFEYLIRRYNVQEHNVDAVMKCILPYHQTNTFVRMVQIMKLKGTMWSFLESTRRTGVAPTREVLADRCNSDRNFLLFICNMVKDGVVSRTAYKVLFSFWAATLIEAMMRRPVTENMVRDVWPYCLYGLNSSNESFQVGSMMVVSGITWRVQVSPQLTASAVDSIAAKCLEHIHSKGFTTLLLLAQNSRASKGSDSDQILTDKALNFILSWHDLVPIINDLNSKNYDTYPLLDIILSRIARKAVNEEYMGRLQQLIEQLNVEKHAAKLTYLLLHTYTHENVSEEDGQSFTRTLAMIDSKYPAQLDEGVAMALQEKLPNKWRNLLRNTRHHPIELDSEAGGDGQSATTLQLCLRQSNPSLQIHALKSLLKIAKNNQSLKALVESTLVEHLSSEHSKVVMNALKVPHLEELVTPTTLFMQLQRLVLSSQDNNVSTTALHTIVRKSLLQKDANFPAAAVPIVLATLLHKDSKMRKETLQLLRNNPPHEIFAGISKSNISIGGKSSLEEYSSLISAVAEGFVNNLANSAIHTLAASLLADTQSKVIAYLVLNRALGVAGSPESKYTIAKLILAQLTRDFDVKTQVKPLAKTPGSKKIPSGIPPISLELMEALLDNSTKFDVKAFHSFLVWSMENILSLTFSGSTYTPSMNAVLEPLFKIIASSPSTETFQPHMQLLLSFIGVHTPNFLELFWTSPQTSGIECLRTLSTLHKFLQDSTDLSSQKLLPLVTSLLVPLTYNASNVRTETLNCLRTLRSLFDKDKSSSSKKSKSAISITALNRFLDIVLDHAKEIQSSHSYIAHIFEKVFSPQQSIAGLSPSELNSLHKFIVSNAIKLPHHYAQMALLSALKQTPNSSKLVLSYDVMVAALNRIKSTISAQTKQAESNAMDVVSANGELSPLGFYECKLLQMLIGHYQPDTVELLEQDGKYFSLLLDLLAAPFEVTFEATDETKELLEFSLQGTALSVITPEFFDRLGQAKQKILFERFCEMVLNERQAIKDVVQAVIRSLNFQPAIISNELEECAQLSVAQQQDERAAKRSKKNAAPATGEEARPWIGRLTVILEMFQYKPSAVLQGVSYIPSLFKLLHNGNQDDSPLVMDPSGEYILHLLFQTLIAITQAISNGLKSSASKSQQASSDAMDVDAPAESHQTPQRHHNKEHVIHLSQQELKKLEQYFDVDSIIQSIRVRKNPTLHNSALILLSYVARVFPAKVLANVMPVFSFMGASSQRSDDNYTFHVIQKTLERVVPSLLQHSGNRPGERVTPSSLLSVFVGRIEHIPPHRRELLFALILKILKPRSYAPLMFCMLLQKHVQITTGQAATPANKSDFAIPEFCLSLASKLPPAEIIASFVNALDLFNNNTERLKHSVLANPTDIIIDHNLLALQVLNMASEYLSSKSFLSQLVAMSPADEEKLQKLYLVLFQALLIYFATVSEKLRVASSSTKQDKDSIDILNQLSDASYRCLEKINELMSFSHFVEIIGGLLQHSNPAIQHKALVLFNDKLTQHQGLISIEQAKVFIDMTQKLFDRIVETESDQHIAYVNKQIAAMSVEIVARQFGRNETHHDSFAKLARQVSSYLVAFTTQDSHNAEDVKVQSSMLIAMATLCTALGQGILFLINDFLPAILKTLKLATPSSESKMPEATQKLLQQSCISSIAAIVRSMARFISSSHLTDLLISLLNPKLAQHAEKISAILDELATLVNARMLLPPMAQAYTACAKTNDVQILSMFFKFTSAVAAHMDVPTTHNQHKAMFKLFLGTFDYRATARKPRTIIPVEDAIISAFVTFVLKLNENLFKPLFLVLVDWAYVNNANITTTSAPTQLNAAIPRWIFFYRLTNSLTDTLRSIFVPYFGYMLDHIVSILNNPSLPGEHSKHSHLLLSSAISALHKCFMYDNEQWVDKDKFNKLLNPLVDQLERTDVGTPEQYQERMQQCVVPCLAQFAVTIGHDALWKPLNYHVLLKTRHRDPAVRLSSLLVVDEFYHRLGEEFLVLLPESVQYFSELLEDPSQEVEQQCMKTIKRIEDLLGEEGGVMNLLK